MLFWPAPFLPGFRLWIPKAVQRSALCRSWQGLSNACPFFSIFFSNKIAFQTHIYLQNLASIQPKTSPVKFARAPCTIITTMWHLGRLFFVRHRGDRTQTGEAQRIPPPQRRHRGLHSEPELCLRAHYGFSMNSPMLSDLCFRLVTFEGSHQRL